MLSEGGLPRVLTNAGNRVEGSWFFSQMKVHRAIFSLSQRLVEIGDEIARIFQSHRDAH